LADQVSTPGSASYRHPISAATFAARFGASHGEVRAVVSSLRAAGLGDIRLEGNSLLISATTSQPALARARLLTLERDSAGRATEASALEAPLVGRSLASDVSAVVGGDSARVTHPAGLALAATAPSGTAPAARRVGAVVGVNGDAGSCSSASTAGYSAGEIADAYGFDALYNDPTPDLGEGSTVALIEFSPYVPSDVATYAECYGLDTSNLRTLDVDGGPGSTASPQGTIEADLDVESVLGLAPDASIEVVEAPNTDQGTIDAWSAAIGSGAQVISTSWGVCESELDPGMASAENTLLQEAAVEGETVVVAAGDSGSEDCSSPSGVVDRLQVDDPASQPFVTGVGGTTLSLSPRAEVVWNTASSASGGGISSLWKMPSYQATSGAPGVLNSDSSGAPCKAGAGDCREVPDVSANAGAAYGIYATVPLQAGPTPEWVGALGTSVSAPTWAALFALADASPACAGGTVGFANPALYEIAAGPDASSAFNDVPPTSAVTNNSVDPSYSSLYPVTAGYDMATGLGSPIAGSGMGVPGDLGLVSQLCARIARSSLPAATIGSEGTSNSTPTTSSPGNGTGTPVSTTTPPASGTTASSGSSSNSLPSGGGSHVDRRRARRAHRRTRRAHRRTVRAPAVRL
jgi:subtilase family serine protease